MRTKKFGGLVPSLMTPLPFNSSSRLLRSWETTALSGEISPGRTTPRNTTVWRSLFIATERSASITRDPLLSTATTRPARLVRKLDFDEACALPCRVAAECGENRFCTPEVLIRSEERRVGKECRSGGEPYG